MALEDTGPRSKRHPPTPDFGPAPTEPPEGVCGECYEPFIDGPHGWMWQHKPPLAPPAAASTHRPACPHSCHADEVWIG
jgi:hypothetical protein